FLPAPCGRADSGALFTKCSGRDGGNIVRARGTTAAIGICACAASFATRMLVMVAFEVVKEFRRTCGRNRAPAFERSWIRRAYVAGMGTPLGARRCRARVSRAMRCKIGEWIFLSDQSCQFGKRILGAANAPPGRLRGPVGSWRPK